MPLMRLPIPNPDEWMGAAAVCALLQISPGTLSRWVHDEKLTAYRPESSNTHIYWRAEVERLARALSLTRGDTGRSPRAVTRA